MEERIFPYVITIGDVMDSTVVHINKENALLRGNPKGTYTEHKGKAVMRLNFAHLLLLQI